MCGCGFGGVAGRVVRGGGGWCVGAVWGGGWWWTHPPPSHQAPHEKELSLSQVP